MLQIPHVQCYILDGFHSGTYVFSCVMEVSILHDMVGGGWGH